jgi:hypothetical protein
MIGCRFHLSFHSKKLVVPWQAPEVVSVSRCVNRFLWLSVEFLGSSVYCPPKLTNQDQL